MQYDDSDLIQQTLEGDQQAFAALVEKYQKQIHALAWQKIGDFHIAQEITQDAFFTAFQKLSTLTDHNRFAGWLYVIANRKCIAWHRKKTPQPQSLETTDPIELEEVYYSEYMTQQREEAANQKRRAVVQKLLSKLQESERTVVNLYYIAEMTCEDIGKFLGVSPNTVRSRLHRARNKLKKEEAMIRENLGSFQLPTQLTENIMKGISQLKPTVPSGSKPLVPLAVSAASAILVLLLIGVGAQNLIRFQKPYNIEAISKPTIEIVETPLVLQSPTEPAVRNQVGRSGVNGQSKGEGQKPDAHLFAAAQIDDIEISNSKQQWVQTKGPEGGAVATLFTTTRADVYAGTISSLYRLANNESTWKRINTRNTHSLSVQNEEISWGVMTERGDTLYLATSIEVMTSTNRGETWKTLSTHPGGLPIGFVITDHAFYLALSEKVYRSEDSGASWKVWTPLNSDKTSITIRAMTAIENTVFVGTDKGLYRLNDNIWEQIPVVGQEIMHEKGIDIHALAVAGDQLYAVKVIPSTKPRITQVSIARGVKKSVTDFGWILYHSNDKGNTWEIIAHKEKILEANRLYFPLQMFGPRRHQFPFTVMGPNLKVKIAAEKGRIVVIDTEYQSYAIDHDGTWVLDDTEYKGSIPEIAPTPVMLNPNTIYSSDISGISRTTDGGKSWQQFNSGLTGTTILDLVFVKDTLYAITHQGLIASTDGGESWTDVFLNGGATTMILKEVKGVLYVRTDRMLLTSGDDDPIGIKRNDGDVKIGDRNFLYMNVYRSLRKNDRTTLNRETPTLEFGYLPDSKMLPGDFAVSGTTFYAERNKKLYRWKPDTTNWHDTGLIDEGESDNLRNSDDLFNATGFKLAVSGKTVYVGKQDGHLMRSSDEGETWTDVTANLPFSVDYFKAMVFAGENVYVATDKGVIRSSNGTDWYTFADVEGTSLVMDSLAVDGTKVYGQTGQNIYQLKRDLDTWQQVTTGIPSLVTCFDVDRDTLYVGTLGNGVLHFSLDE